MKQFKTLVALVLALLLVFTMVGVAFATGEINPDPPATPTYPGSITVTDQKTPAGENKTVTYEAYRIFDLAVGGTTESPDYTALTYTINSAWTGFFENDAAGTNYIVTDNVTTANSGKGYTPIVVNGTRKYIALTDSNVAAFGKAALDYSQKNNIAAVASNTTGSFTNLPLGYYMVYPKGANLNVGNYTSIVSLTTTKPNASVVQKAEYPTLEKVDDDQSVELGQVVHYTLTSKVPDTTGYTKFTFTMHDQMTDGLTFNPSSIDVKIDGVSIGAYDKDNNDDGYTYATETADNGFATAFKIDIPVMKWQAKVGKTITVTYTATVNSNAVTQVEKNHATLEYSNNPKDDTSKETTPPDEEKVFSAKIIINKYDGSNENAKLSGAKFVLRCKSVTETTDSGTKPTATAGSYYKFVPAVAESGTPGEEGYVAPVAAYATWVTETTVDSKVTSNEAAVESDVKNGATIVTTNANGAASFDGLENGVYELIEVKAPEGYNQIKGVAATITVAGTDAATANIEYTAGVANNAGTELPATGGIGTTIFYVAGIVLVLGAAAIIIARRKAEQN